MALLTAWTPLWNEYPDYINYTSDEVRQMIGGQVNAAWLTNTCAIRLSRTLNYNKLPLPGNFSGMNYVLGADGLRYCYRVREIRSWLMVKIGRPQFDHHKKVDASFDKALLAGQKGIIGFDINFPDATGHLDLWDGRIFSSEHRMSRDYWTSATRIWLWTTSGA
jgi:hypothetical protein